MNEDELIKTIWKHASAVKEIFKEKTKNLPPMQRMILLEKYLEIQKITYPLTKDEMQLLVDLLQAMINKYDDMLDEIKQKAKEGK